MKAFFINCTFLIIIQFLPIKTHAQSYSVWDDAVVYHKTANIVNAIYHWDFEEAQKGMLEIKSEIPADHPLPYFLEAIYIFWKNAPMGYDSEAAKKHRKALAKAAELSGKRLEENEKDIEGLFFRLVSQSIMMRSYAEQHETMKAASYVSEVYGLIRKAMARKEEEKEFNFVAGMYNYYREAYPEKYPAYRPVLMFFPKGNKELGLQQLKKSAVENVFTRCEAQLYLVYVNLFYEENFEKALYYAQNLIQEYPKNDFFNFIYLSILERGKKLDKGYQVIVKMDKNPNDLFYTTAAKVFKDIYHIRHKGMDVANYESYIEIEKELEKLGSRGRFLHPYVYGNIYKYYNTQGERSKAKHYYKLAKEHDYFEYLARLE